MKERFVQAIVAGAVFSAVSSAQVFTEPPPIIQLIRMPAANAAAKPYEGMALEVIGMDSVTGSPEFWLLEAHPSFASIEDLDRRTASLVPPHDSQTIIA